MFNVKKHIIFVCFNRYTSLGN